MQRTPEKDRANEMMFYIACSIMILSPVIMAWVWFTVQQLKSI